MVKKGTNGENSIHTNTIAEALLKGQGGGQLM
jgi:hypothetical protein